MLIPYIYHIYIRYIYHIYYVYTILTIWCQWWLYKKMPSSRRWDLAAAVPKEHIPRQRQDLPSELHVAQHVVAPGAPAPGAPGGYHGKTMGGTWWNHGNLGISPRSTGKLGSSTEKIMNWGVLKWFNQGLNGFHQRDSWALLAAGLGWKKVWGCDFSA